MAIINIHSSVQNDLLQIKLLDYVGAVRLFAFLEQSTADDKLLIKLSTHGYRNHDDRLDVKKWNAMFNTGNSVWRLRFTDFGCRDPDYRIFYLVCSEHNAIHILAICRRDEIDYDDLDHPVCRRISKCCAELKDKTQTPRAD